MTAFLVSTYHLPDQAARLVRRLSAVPDATVLVHHDRAAPAASAAALTSSVADLPNVVMLPSRVCRYATFDHVRVTLDGIAWLVEHDLEFGHLVLLTGQCYPLMATDDLAAWFDARAGRTVMEVRPLPHPTWPDGGYNRVDAWLLPLAAERVPMPLRRALPKRAAGWRCRSPRCCATAWAASSPCRVPPTVGELHGGLGYWAMAEAHSRYVHVHKEPYVEFFRHRLHPRRAVLPDDAGQLTAPRRDRPRTMHLVDFHRQGGMNPYIWRSDDLDQLVSSDRPFGGPACRSPRFSLSPGTARFRPRWQLSKGGRERQECCIVAPETSAS